MKDVKRKNSSITDRPCDDIKDDSFDFDKKIVEKIYSFLLDISVTPLTIAVTGEWGIGKTTAINFLQSRLRKDEKNIIIPFEPLLEGKLEIPEIIELFYFQLYQSIKDKKLRKFIKKSLKGLALLSRCKISGKINIPHCGSLGVEKDVGKDIDDLLSLWTKESPKLFSEQAKELNGLLKDKQYKLYIIIDEIDRLTADKMVNFLLFARILELFDDLVCIVGIDYNQVLKKLSGEKYLGLLSDEAAKGYLDKLFQCQFHVYINEYKKIQFAVDELRKIDKEECLSGILDSEDYEINKKFYMIIDYLFTPRQIKKWLILIKINYAILNKAPEKLNLLGFLAVLVKHPELLDNLSTHAIPLLKKRNDFLQLFLHYKYGIYDNTEIKLTILLLASLGLNNAEIEKDTLAKTLQKEAKSIECSDHRSFELIKSFFDKVLVYIVILLAEGYVDESKVSAYHDFFAGNVDETLKILSRDEEIANILANDLAIDLQGFSNEIAKTPSIELLNFIWNTKCAHELGNPYPLIVRFCITSKRTIEEIIQKADLSLSESVLCYMLRKVGINNKNGHYNLNELRTDGFLEDSYTKLLPVQKRSFAGLQEILQQWLGKVETTISDSNTQWFKSIGLISVFYRFVQFSEACDIKNREKLAELLSKFLKNNKISDEDKKSVIELITEECEKYEKPLAGRSSARSPLETLFNNDIALINCIKEISEKFP